ncbi:hypothetical protein ACHHRT_06780 [Desulfurivibrio sp. D14AmB]|uniref:hypothetical protein n=1 Tax=Desulfurivibrio sp. D14AmB TaxID=3374370 RepID=UPI00376EA682
MRPGLAGLIAPLPGLLLLLLLGGCAIRPPTVGEPVLGPDRLAVEREFTAAMAQRRQRLRCLDAEVEVSWRSLLRSGMLPGYLRLMRPSRLIFFGTDPLGRPVLALMVAGDHFRLVVVPEAKAYEGPLTAEAFRRYLPGGVDPELLAESLFDWFSGGLPFAPEIVAVYREREPGEEGGYWLELAEPRYARLLYLPATADSPGLVRRIQLFERRGGAPTQIVFDQYRLVSTEDPAEILPVPHRIELLARRHQGLDLTLRLSEMLADCPPAADFQLIVPRGFLLEQVQ